MNGPAITHNRAKPLSYPGFVVDLQWEAPGKPIGPDSLYTTNTSAGPPAFVAWVSQLNTTYTKLDLTGDYSGTTVQPPADGVINGTIFIAIVDADPFITPHNISMLNEHIVAGPAIYQAS